ncbi:MAG: HlyD family efflux transporter periplasmic adaptor subunit, partial [Desulfobacterales bacterium]|nr:HlyD family efflux transporter periplasmic adaptor subunit [Desulfobacterales bacterium]
DRVSLGFIKGRHARVITLSHAAEFGKETNLMRAIGAVMDEAIDQHTAVAYPLPPDGVPLVTRAHEELSRQYGSRAILTIPLENKGVGVGGLTLEQSGDNAFDPHVVEACKTVAAVVGPILDTKRLEDRWLIRKAVDSFAAQGRRLLGPRYLLRKMVSLLILAIIVFFYVYEVDYRVTAQTSIEGSIQRVVAAPFDGYIKEAPIRPGDIVKEGDLLCLLDDRDQRLERIKWLTEREQLIKQYHEAMAKHDRSQIRIVRTKIDQAEAQLALIDEQLARTRVAAPFDGVVMSGDLSQSLGSPVERGKVLFEVAPLDQYRVIVQVDEREITDIAVGQQSELVLSSVPGEAFPFIVEKITSVSTAKEGRNYFRVEGRLQEATMRLRPGMEGIGKINIDRRKLIWVWTHNAVDWLRLQLWRYRP